LEKEIYQRPEIFEENMGSELFSAKPLHDSVDEDIEN
jgi:hypothetical protein